MVTCEYLATIALSEFPYHTQSVESSAKLFTESSATAIVLNVLSVQSAYFNLHCY